MAIKNAPPKNDTKRRASNMATTPPKTTKKTALPAAAKKVAPTPAPKQLNTKQVKTRLSKAKKGALAMRKQLWPDVTDAMLWTRHDKSGFTTIPRPMPLFLEIINDASKQVTNGKSVPAGKSYLVLWCRVFDEAFVKIDADPAAALEAGYEGERNVSTWREHLRVLKELDFIDYKAGPSGPCQYVLLLNPYHATKKLNDKGWVQPLKYTALFQRAQDIRADDLEDDNEDDDVWDGK